MGQRCVLRGCKNKGKNSADVRYHRFPRDPETRKKWEEYVSQHNEKAWTAYKSAVICSVHFLPEQYLNGALRPESLPSIAAGTLQPSTSNPITPAKCVTSTLKNVPSCDGDSIHVASEEKELSCSVESTACAQAGSVPSITVSSSVGVNFMGVPGITNSLLDGTSNVLINVMDQQSLCAAEQTGYLGVGSEEHEAAVASITGPDEEMQLTETDPQALYGDLSQFIIFKSSTCSSLPTDGLSNENDIPSHNGLAVDVKSCSLLTGLNAGSKLENRVDCASQTDLQAESDVQNKEVSSLNPIISRSDKITQCDHDSLLHVDKTDENVVKAELLSASSAGVLSSIKTKMHSTPSNTEQDCASPTATIQGLSDINVRDGPVGDCITNGNIVDEETVMETSNEMYSRSDKAFTRPEKRCINSASSDNDDFFIAGKKIKICGSELQPEDFESPASRVHNLSILKDIINDKNHLLDNTQKTVQMLRERLKDLESLLNRLKEDSHISSYVKNIIQEDFPQLDKPAII